MTPVSDFGSVVRGSQTDGRYPDGPGACAMGERYDVVIAGAGIAGCAAATLYGQQGLRVGLLEQHRDASTFKRACTHFIQPSALPTMRRLGLDRRIESAGGVRNTLDFWTPYGWITAETITAGQAEHGYNIRRSVLDPMLREMAARTPGVDLLLGHNVVEVLRQGERVTGLVASAADGTRHEVHGRLTVGADGRQSAVADRSGVPVKTTPHGRFGFSPTSGVYARRPMQVPRSGTTGSTPITCSATTPTAPCCSPCARKLSWAPSGRTLKATCSRPLPDCPGRR